MVEDENIDIPAGAEEPKRGATRRARKKKAVVETGRRQKEFTYRGRSVEDLRALPQEELLQLLPTRARRFFRNGLNDLERSFYEKAAGAEDGDTVRTHLREFPIMPQFVGKTFEVYTGKDWQKVVVTAEMIGHKLGEFALTRRFGAHTGPGVGATRSSKFMPLK